MAYEGWDVQWYVCRADYGDEQYWKKEHTNWAKAKKTAETRGRKFNKPEPKRYKAGDEMWRVPVSIGPITTDHNHWAGYHLEIDEEDTKLVAAAPALLKAAEALVAEYDKTPNPDPAFFNDLVNAVKLAREGKPHGEND